MNKDAMQEIDLLARLLINESLVKMDDIKDDDVPGLARAAIMQLLKQVAALRARAEQAEAENQALVDDNQILMWRLRKVVEVEVKWRANVATSGMEIYLELLNELRGVLQFAVVKQAALAGQVKP